MDDKKLEKTKESLVEVLHQFNEIAELLREEQEKKKWVPVSRIPHYLGEGITPKMVKNRIQNGSLIHGVHYVDTSDSAKPHYVVCPEQIEKFFLEPPEYRET